MSILKNQQELHCGTLASRMKLLKDVESLEKSFPFTCSANINRSLKIKRKLRSAILKNRKLLWNFRRIIMSGKKTINYLWYTISGEKELFFCINLEGTAKQNLTSDISSKVYSMRLSQNLIRHYRFFVIYETPENFRFESLKPWVEVLDI